MGAAACGSHFYTQITRLRFFLYGYGVYYTFEFSYVS